MVVVSCHCVLLTDVGSGPMITCSNVTSFCPLVYPPEGGTMITFGWSVIGRMVISRLGNSESRGITFKKGQELGEQRLGLGLGHEQASKVISILCYNSRRHVHSGYIQSWETRYGIFIWVMVSEVAIHHGVSRELASWCPDSREQERRVYTGQLPSSLHFIQGPCRNPHVELTEPWKHLTDTILGGI